MTAPHYTRERSDDLQAGAELSAGPIIADRATEFVPIVTGSTHLGQLTVAGDAILVLTGSLASDKPQRPQVILVTSRRRADAVERTGRVRNRVWNRIIGPVYDQPEHLAELVLAGGSNLGLNALVITPNVVLGQLDLQGGSTLTLAATRVIRLGPGEGLAMVGDATMVATGSEIFGSPRLAMVGDAKLQMRGSGGADASLDASQRRGGIVTIGTRGGHA